MAYRFNLLYSVENRSSKRSSGQKAGPAPGNAQGTVAGFDLQKLNALSRSICAIEPDDFPGMLIVANAADEREKGEVAVHLAKDVARMPGQSVFLVDADLTYPSVHNILGMSISPGLGEYLADERPLASLIRKTSQDGLQVLTAGHGIGRESSLLSSSRMTRFVRELKNKCPGLVLIFTMDVKTLSESAPSFVDQADGVVLALDETWLPPAFKNKPIDLPRNARLLGVIRKHGAGGSGQPSEDFNPDDTAVSFVRPNLDAHQAIEGSPLVALNRPVSFETEQFNKLTADMIRSDVLDRRQVFMVTSPMSGDGKSYVACNTAVSLARNTGKQVLVVDCDLRSPSIHSLFNLPNRIGLSTFLHGENDTLSECIQKTCIENLFVLPAGPATTHPLPLVSSDRMIRLIEGIKKRFKDMVIILDAASPVMMAEGHVVTKMADALILVASRKQTRKDEMKKLTEMVEKDKIYGVVYNHYVKKRSILGFGRSNRGYKEAA